MGGPAWEIPGFSYSLPANIDMSVAATYQYTPVRALAASGNGIYTPVACAPVAATGDAIVGVLQNNPQLAEAGTIVNNGISMALVKQAVAIGTKLSAAPTGGFKPAITGEYASAIALGASDGAGELIAVLLVNLGKV